MKAITTVLRASVLISLMAAPVFAAPYIRYEMSHPLPTHLTNPLGGFTAECWVELEGTEPELLEVYLFDSNDVLIYYYPVPYATYYRLDWSVPVGSPDGIYHYQVDYQAQNGETAQVRGGFLVTGGGTTALCGFKFIDEDGDGIFDQEDEGLAPGWEICVNPSLGCKTTNEDGAACWFFIPPNEYQACETRQVGYTNTTPVCQVVVVQQGQFGKVMFGNELTPPPPTGACCLPNGDCIVLTEEECLQQGGIFQGVDVPCDPTLCPQPRGACCLPNGDCVETTEDDCLAHDGIYYGDGFPCSPTLCPQPRGACCMPDGTCIETTEDDCLANGGEYIGDGVSCDVVDCPPPVPVEKSTWGQIKNRYRQ